MPEQHKGYERDRTENIEQRDGEVVDSDFNLDSVVTYVLKNHPELNEGIDELVKQYRCFIYLCGVFSSTLSVPSPEIDKIWHGHILHTKDYAEFCNAVAGQFIHHNPFADAKKNDPQRIERARQKLIEAQQKHFGRLVFQNISAISCDVCCGGQLSFSDS